MVPLAPGQRVCRIICRGDLQRPGCVLSIHIDRYCSATIRCVEEVGHVCSRARYIDCDVEPLTGFGPANIEQIRRRNNLVEGVIVDRIWLALKLGVGSIYSLMDTKFIEVGPTSRLPLSAAVILRIALVIPASLPSQLI